MPITRSVAKRLLIPAVGLVAILLRLGAWPFVPAPAITGDSRTYELLSWNLISSGQFSSDESPPFSPNTSRAPLYPWLLSGAVGLFGRSGAVAVGLNCLLGGLLAGGTALVARQAYRSEWLAAASGLAAGVLPELFAATYWHQVELLWATLGVFSLYFLLRYLDEPGTEVALWFGLLGGLQALTKPTSIPFHCFVAGVLVLVVRRRAAIRFAIAAGGACMLLVVPWSVRTSRIVGRPVPVVSIGAEHVLFTTMGAEVPRNGSYEEWHDSIRQKLATRTADETRSGGVQQALALMAARPTIYLRYFGTKLARLATEVPGEHRLLKDHPEVLKVLRAAKRCLLVAGVLGLAVTFRFRPGFVFGAYAGTFWVLHSTVLGSASRYVLPTQPVLLLLGMGLVARASGVLRRPRATGARLKVVTSAGFFLAQDAGSRIHFRELMEKLSRFCDIIVFAPAFKKGRRLRVRTVFLPTLPLTRLYSPIFELVLVPVLAVRCLFGRPDLAYFRYQLTSLAPVVLRKALRVPVVLEVNGIADEELALRGISRSLRRLARLLLRMNATSATSVIAVTPGIRTYLIDQCGVRAEKAFVIQNGVNVDIYRPLDGAAARQRLKVSSEARVIGYVGSLSEWQGVERLIELVALLRKGDTNAEAVIVGDGRLMETLVAEAAALGVSAYVRFVGARPYEEVPEWIACFDVGFCMKRPLGSGYSPLKLYSYLACAVPVLATDTEGFELVREAACGLLVPFALSDATVEGVAELLRDEKRRKSFGENGRRLVECEHSWEAVAERTVAVFEATVGQP